jgi:N-ethylmaleimide reductase
MLDLFLHKFKLILNKSNNFAEKKLTLMLFEPYNLRNISLKNRIVMAPMTRCRAINSVPNDLMAIYYAQRASAGLIITEGVSPSPNGLGYIRMPGIFTEEQAAGWKKITGAVHNQGGRIFIQIMHTGRMGHSLNLPEGAEVVAPSALAAPGQMYTDAAGMKDLPVPRAMTSDDIKKVRQEYMKAAILAISSGFDGVELHGANGYLPEQFLSPHTNQRQDEYGGSVENRCRFVLEVTEAIGRAIGMDKTAIRLSPYGVGGGMKPYPEVDETYTYLSGKLDQLGILYIHLVDHSAAGAPEVPLSIKQAIRNHLHQTQIMAGGYAIDTAQKDLQSGLADLIAFGKPFISNPDLVDRLQHGYPLNTHWDVKTFYTSGPEGYIDYPPYK